MRDEVAEGFILHAIQDWGQSEQQRVAAVQRVIDAAGFDAQATCSPVFGGIWPEGCAGPDAEAATQFLRDLTQSMERGKFEREAAHVSSCIAQAKAARP